MTSQITFDIEELTLGDVEHLVDEFGDDVLTQLRAAEQGKSIPIKLLVHFVWRMLRHSNPDATLDDARNVRIADLPDDEPEDEEGKGSASDERHDDDDADATNSSSPTGGESTP